MSDWDKLLFGLVVLAIVAVVVASPQASAAIASIGAALSRNAKNVAGG